MVRVCTLMAGILALGEARAEDTSRVAQARSHFLAGKTAYRDGRYQEALSEFDGQQQVLNEKLYAEARRGMLDKIKRNSPKNINFVGD